MIKKLSDLNKADLQGKKAIVRVDFNVPIALLNEVPIVSNSYRIERAMPTINFLRENGAKILLISHIETKGVDRPTLKPVLEYLVKKFPELKITFLKSFFGVASNIALDEIKEGEIILFENIRQYEEEKENNEAFAKSVASLGNLYVNDAFAVSHRKHASVVGIPKFIPSYAGLLLDDEIKNLTISENIVQPFLFILGGAKFETKLPLIKKFLDIARNVFIGGALANDLLKTKGFPVGKSLVSENVSLRDLIDNPKLIMPVDVVTKNEDEVQNKNPGNVLPDDVIVDIGEQTVNNLKPFIEKARYILWNGPFGNFEFGFKNATLKTAELVGQSSAHSVIGGGDTLAAIQELNLLDKFSFVSTGGGAMLDYLLDGTLVGIEALKR